MVKKDFSIARRESRQELAEVRQRYARAGSPCGLCRRDACPPVCYPRKDWNEKRRQTGATPARGSRLTVPDAAKENNKKGGSDT